MPGTAESSRQPRRYSRSPPSDIPDPLGEPEARIGAHHGHSALDLAGLAPVHAGAGVRDADRIIPEDLLVEHDDLDRRLHEGMVDHGDRRRLLETIPDVDRVSAIAILVEASPDPVAVFGSAKHLAA